MDQTRLVLQDIPRRKAGLFPWQRKAHIYNSEKKLIGVLKYNLYPKKKIIFLKWVKVSHPVGFKLLYEHFENCAKKNKCLQLEAEVAEPKTMRLFFKLGWHQNKAKSPKAAGMVIPIVKYLR